MRLASNIFGVERPRHHARGTNEGGVHEQDSLDFRGVRWPSPPASATAAFANEKVTFGTNWLAQAEHGGYYQAVADGTYAACGLDVTIMQGGPQVSGRPLLLAGKIDFYMGGNMQQAFDAVTQNIPLRVVAASFQKEPQVLMSHPGQGLDTWEDLPKAEQYIIGDEGAQSFLLVDDDRIRLRRRASACPTPSTRRRSSPTRSRSSRAT